MLRKNKTKQHRRAGPGRYDSDVSGEQHEQSARVATLFVDIVTIPFLQRSDLTRIENPLCRRHAQIKIIFFLQRKPAKKACDRAAIHTRRTIFAFEDCELAIVF